jgi:dUTPase
MTEETKPKKKGKAATASKKSPATNYSTPNLFSIATEVTVNEPEFMPVYTDPLAADVRIITPFDPVYKQQSVRLNQRTTVVLDTGVNIKLPAGFRLNGAAKRELAVRGLFVSQVFLDNDRLKIVATNIGTENPIVLNHKSVVAQIWLEPVYFFDWSK